MKISKYPKDQNLCLDNNTHRFSRSPDTIAIMNCGYGKRKIYRCNNCLAILVKFEVDDPDSLDEILTSEQIVSPNINYKND